MNILHSQCNGDRLGNDTGGAPEDRGAAGDPARGHYGGIAALVRSSGE